MAIIQYYKSQNNFKKEISFSFLELKEIFESNEKYLSNLVNKTFKKKVYDEVNRVAYARHKEEIEYYANLTT